MTQKLNKFNFRRTPGKEIYNLAAYQHIYFNLKISFYVGFS